MKHLRNLEKSSKNSLWICFWAEFVTGGFLIEKYYVGREFEQKHHRALT